MMPIMDIQPSQLYINEEKLKYIRQRYAGHSETIPPIPIKKIDKDIILTDGHTRAFAAYQAGIEKIKVCWDSDELDWYSYKICVNWCKEEGINSIADLEGRIVKPSDFDILWIKRCKELHQTGNRKVLLHNTGT